MLLLDEVSFFRLHKASTIGRMLSTVLQSMRKGVCHREAVEVVITLPATTRGIGEQLSHQHALQKEKNRDALYSKPG